MADINKAGVLIIEDDKFMLCRKNDTTTKLIIPGGSIEAEESPEDCIIREVCEELGKEVQLSELQYLETYEDIAAYDDPKIQKTVKIILYQAKMTGAPIPSSEIVEIIWFDSNSDINELSPIIKNKILPDIINKKILQWKT